MQISGKECANQAEQGNAVNPPTRDKDSIFPEMSIRICVCLSSCCCKRMSRWGCAGGEQGRMHAPRRTGERESSNAKIWVCGGLGYTNTDGPEGPDQSGRSGCCSKTAKKSRNIGQRLKTGTNLSTGRLHPFRWRAAGACRNCCHL